MIKENQRIQEENQRKLAAAAVPLPSSGGLFGSAAQSGGISLFSTSAPATGGLFNQQPVSGGLFGSSLITPQPTSGLLGSASQSGSGLFGNSPQMGGGGGGLFGSSAPIQPIPNVNDVKLTKE